MVKSRRLTASHPAVPTLKGSLRSQGLRYIFSRPTITLEPSAPISIAIRLMAYRGLRHLPVVDNKNLLEGLITAKEIVDLLGGGSRYQKIVKSRGNLYEALFQDARNIMVSAIVAHENDAVKKIAEIMSRRKVGAVCFADKANTFRGIITLRDIIIQLVRKTQNFGVKVEKVMTADPLVVPPEEKLRAVMELMISKNIRRVMVADGHGLIGIASNKDVLRFFDENTTIELLKAGAVEGVHCTPVSRIVSRNVVSVGAKEDVGLAVGQMARFWVSALPVMEKDKLVGIITERDVVDALYERNRLEF